MAESIYSEKSNSLVKSGLRLSVLTFASRILGLVREAVKAAYLGTSPLADAFSISFMIPNLLRRLFAENSMSVAFIPVFRDYMERNDAHDTKEFLSAMFTMLTFLVTVTTVLGIIITPLIIPFFGTLNDESVLLTRIMFPYLICIAVAALFQGILNGVKCFAPSGFTPVLFNICVILGTIALSRFTKNAARSMATGVVAGGIVQALFQLPFVLRHGFRFRTVRLSKAFSHPGTKMVLKLIGPTIIGMAAYQLNDVVSSALAGNAGSGVVSSLQYSLRIQELILGIFAVSIGTVILPDLTGFAGRKMWSAFNDMLTNAMNCIALITIPVTAFSLVCGENIISLIFRSRLFTDESVNLTMSAFTWHIAGLYFIALNRIVSPSFYAQKDTRSPTVAGLISFGVNILLAIVLVTPLKGAGIAMALSAASAANTVALFVFLRKKETVDVSRVVLSTVKYAVKIAAISVIAIVPVFFLRPVLCAQFAGFNRLVSQGIPLAVCGCLFVVIAAVLLIVVRDKTAAALAASLKRKLVRGKKTEKD